MGIAQKINGQIQARRIRDEGWRLSLNRRRERVIPMAVMRALANSNLPRSKRAYTKRLRQLLREHEETSNVAQGC
jgi:hypothetical protein